MLLFCVSVLGAGRIYHPGGDCNVTVLCFISIILAEIVMLLFCVSALVSRLYHPGGDCNVTVLCFSTRCWSDVSSWRRL